jgi:hypothetical protein
VGATVQTDLAFPGRPPEGDRLGTPLFLATTAERLPFADRSFDYAVSLDMFEHLPLGIRDQSVRELCRVSRKAVLVGFPVGRPAKAVDEVLYRLLRLRRSGVPDWLVEHRAQERYPDQEMLANALPAAWVIKREITSGNVVSQTALVWAEQLPGARRVTEHLEDRWRARGVPRLFDRGATYRRIFVVQPVLPV